MERHYYSNGNIHSQVLRLKGSLEGDHKIWHENGQLMINQVWQNGNPEGKYISWYGNGYPLAILSYRAGIVEGEYKYWNRNGRPYWFCWCKNGNENVIDRKFTSQKKENMAEIKKNIDPINAR